MSSFLNFAKHNSVLLIIVILATILRFYQLGQNPPSLDWDETAHGYNAYSILKTGRDEYAYKLPLYFRSFDDYKPPIYTYLVVPSVAVFGLNDFAVRFPSALLGVLAIIFTYLMVFELFKRKGIRAKNSKIVVWMSLAALAFGANLFMYHNARVFIPIYSLMLIVLYKDNLFANKKYLIVPSVITLIFLALLIPIITSIAGQLRYKGTTIFADVSPQFKASELIAQDEEAGQLTIGKLL